MQSNNHDGYFSIYFEKMPNLTQVKEILLAGFNQQNIEIRHNDEIIEIWNNVTFHLFEIYMIFTDLTDDNHKRMYQDVAVIALLYVCPDLNPIHRIINLLHQFSKAIHTKIYIAMEDIGLSDLYWINNYAYWCINENGLSVYFDAEEFEDNCVNRFMDYLPYKFETKN